MKLEETLRALFDANVEIVLIGGAAMQMQGSADLTEDLDFCYARSSKNLERLALAFGTPPPKTQRRPGKSALPFRRRHYQTRFEFHADDGLGLDRFSR